MATARISNDVASGNRVLTVELERNLGMNASDEASLLRQAVRDGIKKVAEQWVEENRDKIIERLNVDAIANMIMLEVANDIKKDARKEPDNG